MAGSSSARMGRGCGWRWRGDRFQVLNWLRVADRLEARVGPPMVSEQRNPSGTNGVSLSNILSPKWNLSMKSPACLLTVILMTALLVACSSEPWPIASSSTSAPSSTAAPTSSTQAAAITPSLPVVRTAVATSQCTPTWGDELSPSYKPDAPVRSVVGQGHILTGIVRSSVT